MLSNSTKKPFVVPTPESTKAFTPDSSKNYAKATGKNRNNRSINLQTYQTTCYIRHRLHHNNQI
eukprot:7122707-Ditylum_brightwellii.AAC.1